MSERVFNFSAGPATLPLPVLERVKEELLAYPGAGASVMEISHRSKAFLSILAEAKADLKALLNLSDDYHVLFTPGGATMQFTMLAMNFLAGKKADYLNVGSWAGKAIKDGKRYGETRVAWSGKDENYVRMPADSELDLDPGAEYVHITSNETIQGIQFRTEPAVNGKPIICDASSDFLSRPLDMAKYGMIYAGAQKNVGPSGTAVVVLRADMLERVPENLPPLLDYRVTVENDSLYNTPASFTIYIIGLVMKWLRNEIGGLEAMQKINEEKAALLYEAIDASGGFYRGHALPGSRSKMNVTFRVGDEEQEKRFIAEATAAGLDALKGHRSVGGCRASIYNAMPVEGVRALRDFMVEFQRVNG
ncbi:MAG: 3-phosphoserine/phosphohydroxythreonine transaminase [Candidatus Hydrogenedens sp.]|nr:3-phosphoserine/phosphohydroxythreonine transaminase [Candidatus Hydrogenedentota bacterium]NLF59388.1 3-phosphoserine/phosphohydroxythreonine transaminase [Candidatus Hydrogenedens sp.]